MRLIHFILTSVIIYANIAAADINSVMLGQMENDNAPFEFSTIINFTPKADFSSWQFGFYMPRIFASQGAFNPDLIMQICNAANVCANLIYQKAASITQIDQSVGYTTILAPTTSFPLKNGQAYTIKLLHSNQWNPGNYSSVPQNFFITANNKTYNLASTQNTYQLLNYNQDNIDAVINNHISADWYNSVQSMPVNLIVPSPVSYKAETGVFMLEQEVHISDSLSTNNASALLYQQTLMQDIHVRGIIDGKLTNKGIIIQKIGPALVNNNPEGYTLEITPNTILVGALNDTGAFYALQTLRQLWIQNPRQLQNAAMVDYPRFKYRGILLDTARHYFTVYEIKNFIDVMAAHKLNTLHIHFTDDEGFRLVLPEYPALTSVGAIRAYGDKIGPMMFLQKNLDITDNNLKPYPAAGDTYKGAYSKEDIATLIQYANTRQITIIPEIDIPAHARALIKSLPASFVDPNDHSVFSSVGGYTDDVLPVCTYDTNITVGPLFTANINAITNLIAHLFNGQTTLYARNNEISVGADEVSANAWTNDSSCQAAWANLSALGKAQKFLQMLAASNSDLLISGWQQLVQNDDESLGSNVVPASQVGHIYVWSTVTLGIKQAINLAQNNYPTVLAFADQTYFDLAYTPDIKEPGFSWATPFSDTYAGLSSAVSANSTIDGIADASQKANILGIEGALWSENLASYNHLLYMALPKMAGLSEASWSPSANIVTNGQQLNWPNLAARLGCGQMGFLSFLNKTFGVQYRGFPHGIKEEVPAGTICT